MKCPYLAKHELIAYHTNCKVVYQKSVVLSAHHLRSHVAWSARGVLGVFWLEDPCDAHVSDPHIAIAVHHQIFRFDVSVNNPMTVHVLKALDYAANHKSYQYTYYHCILLVCSSENLLCLPMWYLRSPPDSKSQTRNRSSLS